MSEPKDDDDDLMAPTPAAAEPEAEALAARIAEVAEDTAMPRKERDKRIAELLDLLDQLQDSLAGATESDRRRIMGMIREIRTTHRPGPTSSSEARKRWGGKRSA